jgi:hypothetical protein
VVGGKGWFPAQGVHAHFVNLLSIHNDFFGSADADAHFISLDCYHLELDIVADNDHRLQENHGDKGQRRPPAERQERPIDRINPPEDQARPQRGNTDGEVVPTGGVLGLYGGPGLFLLPQPLFPTSFTGERFGATRAHSPGYGTCNSP